MTKTKTKNPICIFCNLPIDINKEYYSIKKPDGKWVDVHGHLGVKEHGGIKMKNGHPVREDE